MTAGIALNGDYAAARTATPRLNLQKRRLANIAAHRQGQLPVIKIPEFGHQANGETVQIKEFAHQEQRKSKPVNFPQLLKIRELVPALALGAHGQAAPIGKNALQSALTDSKGIPPSPILMKVPAVLRRATPLRKQDARIITTVPQGHLPLHHALVPAPAAVF